MSAIYALAVYGGAVAAELYLMWRERAEQTAGAAGPIDTRRPIEVALDLRQQGIDAYPAMNPNTVMKRRARRAAEHPSAAADGLAPLAGVANTHTVFCREAPEYAFYEADEHGFNNPRGLWALPEIDIVAVGDSFAHGACVSPGQDMMSLIRDHYPRALNLGYVNAGPLVELATLKEYAAPLRPKLVLWFFFEGNDEKNLKLEARREAWRAYFSSAHTQRLIERQAEIDRLLASVFDEMARSYRDRGRLAPLGEAWEAVSKVLDVRRVRYLIGLRLWNNELDEPALMRRVFAEARRVVEEWQGRIVLVYMPSRLRYMGYDREVRRLEETRRFLYRIAAELDLPVVSVLDALERQDDPSALFADPPWLYQVHFKPEGYRVAADAVLEYLRHDTVLAEAAVR